MLGTAFSLLFGATLGPNFGVNLGPGSKILAPAENIPPGRKDQSCPLKKHAECSGQHSKRSHMLQVMAENHFGLGAFKVGGNASADTMTEQMSGLLTQQMPCLQTQQRVLTGGEFPVPIVISENHPRRQGLCQRLAGAVGQEFRLEANFRLLL